MEPSPVQTTAKTKIIQLFRNNITLSSNVSKYDTQYTFNLDDSPCEATFFPNPDCNTDSDIKSNKSVAVDFEQYLKANSISMNKDTNMDIIESITDEIVDNEDNFRCISASSYDDDYSDTEYDSIITSPVTPFFPDNYDKENGSALNGKMVTRLVRFSDSVKHHKIQYSPSSKSETVNMSFLSISETDDEAIERADPMELMEKHLIQHQNPKKNMHKSVYFDKCIYSADNNKIAMISSNGLNKGTHEWVIEILKCDVYLQEIGVIGCDPKELIRIADDGIRGTDKFGARSVYGNELSRDIMYYSSYNDNGKTRCFRDLTDKHHIGWCTNDVIKVCIDLDKWRIRYYLNGCKVRKAMSLQPGKIYYPVISFSGNCQYCVVSK